MKLISEIVILLIVLLILLSSCVLKKEGDNTYSENEILSNDNNVNADIQSFFLPESISFFYDNRYINESTYSSCYCSYKFLSTNKDELIDLANIKDYYLIDNLNNLLNPIMEIQENGKLVGVTINQKDVYYQNILLKFKFDELSHLLQYARLVCLLKSNKKLEYYIGNISILPYSGNINEDVIRINNSLALYTKGESDNPYTSVSCFLIEVEAKEEVEINKIDLGILGYGIDKNNISVFDMDLKSAHKNFNNSCMTMDISANQNCTYDIDNVVIKKGISTICVPFQYVNELEPPIRKFGAYIEFTHDSEKYIKTIHPFNYYVQHQFSIDYISDGLRFVKNEQ